MMHDVMRDRRTGTLVSIVLLALTALAYWPGTSGGFQFDDVHNIRALEDFGPIGDFRTLAYYATSGTADPTGRPVSVLSFLVNADDWPENPRGFKLTNIAIHLLNGVLLMLVVLRLERALANDPAPGRTALVAVFSGGLWLLHPLFVSTTLYVVQRHAMLPLTFCLFGFLAFDAGWQRLSSDRHHSGLLLALGGAAVATLLSGLSKPNGFLVPLLLLLALVIVYRSRTTSIDHAVLARLRLGLLLPSFVVLAGLIGLFALAAAAGDALPRPWTMLERTLTQPRILVDYLYRIIVPQEGSTGLFADDIEVSTGLLSPWSTLPAALLIASLAILAWRVRAVAPRLSFALAFYLVGHIVESLAIPLELYFEHRNYLPAAFLFWPLASWLVNARPARALRIALMLTMPALLFVLTCQRATLWGNDAELSAVWAARAPDSARAQVQAAAHDLARGNDEVAVKRLSDVLSKYPLSVEASASMIGYECSRGGVLPVTYRQARHAIANTPVWHEGMFNWLTGIIERHDRQPCNGFRTAEIAGLINAAMSNPHIPLSENRRQKLTHLLGRLALADNDPGRARDLFDSAVGPGFEPSQGLVQIALLGEAGCPALALQHAARVGDSIKGQQRPSLRSMQALHQHLLSATGYYDDELAHLERVLNDEIVSGNGQSCPETP